MKYISRLLIYSLLTTILLLSCNSEKNKHRDGDIVFLRYEQVIFDSAEKELPQRLAEFKNQFKSPLLNIFPDDQMFMEQLRGFIADGTVRDIAEASEILDLKALTRKPIKRYLFKYRIQNKK